MTELVIRSGKEVELSFHSRRINSEGWVESYVVAAKARNFSASVEVANEPFGIPPTDLFERMATSWMGWKGEVSWGALEGEYNLVATCDSLGHVTLVAELNPSALASKWTGVLQVELEAGSLEDLSRDAKIFFYPNA